MTEREWVEDKIGKGILEGLDDIAFHHYYRGIKDYGMSFYDADRWAWLNTLFRYDIGAERALDIITWYDDNGMDVLDFEVDDKESIENVCQFELGLHLNFSGWLTETPKYIEYGFKEWIE